MKDSASADWLSSAAHLSPSCCSRNQKKTFFCLRRPTSLWYSSVCLSVWICFQWSALCSSCLLMAPPTLVTRHTQRNRIGNRVLPKRLPHPDFLETVSLSHTETQTQEWSCWLFYKNSVHLWIKTSTDVFIITDDKNIWKPWKPIWLTNSAHFQLDFFFLTHFWLHIPHHLLIIA